MRIPRWLLLVFVSVALALPAGALTISGSASAPASAAISKPDFSATAFNGAQDFTDNAGPPGQSFTTGAVPFILSAVTVKGFANNSNSFGGLATATWTLTISILNAGVLTTVVQETSPVFNPASGSDYFTLTLATPVPLTASTVYAYDIFTSAGYVGFAKSTVNVYAGGTALQHGSTARTAASGATATNLQVVDRTFFIHAIPEPGVALLLGGALLGHYGLRRRRQASGL
jgi:hypothetical protein